MSERGQATRAKRKASDLFIECLEAEGCEYIFGVPGEENLDVVESLRTSSIELVLVRHEQSAELLDRRMACLDQGLAELRALTTRLAHADRLGIERAVKGATELTSLARCADAETLMAPLRPPAGACARLRDHTRGWPHWDSPGWRAAPATADPWRDLLIGSGRA